MEVVELVVLGQPEMQDSVGDLVDQQLLISQEEAVGQQAIQATEETAGMVVPMVKMALVVVPVAAEVVVMEVLVVESVFMV
jgi:hypothetical protein